MNKPIRFWAVGFGLYIGDIEEDDVDLLFVFFLGNDIVTSFFDERIDIESFLDFCFEISGETDIFFFVSKLFKRFNGLLCSYCFVIVNDFVLSYIIFDNASNWFVILLFIGGELGKLLILYNDKSILSNLSKHRNFESIGGIETNGFSGRGSFITNGATREDCCGIDDGRVFPVS